MQRWIGNIAVVTGASAGIGAATVVALANHGMKVVGLARRPELVEKLSTQVKHINGQVYSRKCNICSETDVAAAFSWIKKELGGVDVLVNNAGIIRQGTLVDVGTSEGPISADTMREILNTNVLGLVFCAQHATKSMRARRLPGHIININSIVGHYQPEVGEGVPLMNIYAPSKFAVTAITEQIRKEFSHSETNIRVTSISPGLVQTEMFAEGRMDQLQDMLATKKGYLQSEDVAGAVIYALSQPQYLTIQELKIRPTGDKF